MRKLFALLLTALLGIGLATAPSAGAATSSQWQLLYGYYQQVTVEQGNGTWSAFSYYHGTSCSETRWNLQGDGNLVRYWRHSDAGACPAAWRVMASTGTSGANHKLVFQRDNHIVLYDAWWRAVWAIGPVVQNTSSWVKLLTNSCLTVQTWNGSSWPYTYSAC